MVLETCFTPSPLVRSRSAYNLRETPRTKREQSIVPFWPYGLKLNRYNAMGHITNYYNPARQCIYQRYSEAMWDLANKAATKNAAHERAEAEQLRLETWRAIRNTDQQTRNRQSEATTRLKERVENINCWKNELSNEAVTNEREQERLTESLRVLSLAHEHIKRPLKISSDCLVNREQRQGIEEVKDIVERELNKEIKLINCCSERICKLLEKGEIQQRLMRAAQFELQKDINDKNDAHKIDYRMQNLCNSSADLGLYQGIELYDNTRTVPVSWNRFTQNNLLRSQSQRNASEKLRETIEALLRSVSAAVHGQFVAVNNALQSRITEVSNARDLLRSSSKKALQEIYDTENMIHLLQKSMEDKLQPLKVAETRLKERTERLNMESCYDQAMKSLQTEVVEIRNAIRDLKNRRRHGEITLSRLKQNQQALDNEIQNKDHTLAIDQNCLNMRRSFPIRDRRGSLFSVPVCY